MYDFIWNRIALCGLALVAFVPRVSAGADLLYGIRSEVGSIIVRSLDLSSSAPVQEHGRLAQLSAGRTVSIFQKKDRGIGVVRTSLDPNSTRRASVRMLGTPEKLMDVSIADVGGLPSTDSIASLLVPMSGRPLALIAHYSDTPPYSLANVDLDLGSISQIKIALHPLTRYSQLAQCPNGAIYTVSMAPQWNTRLVQLDLDKQTIASVARIEVVNSESLRTVVRGLACAPSGELYALADPANSGSNSIYRIDIVTGRMTWIRKFDVDQMVFVR